jgi:tRNA dimethylallyltransferase
MDHIKRITIVVGPTAVGKTDFAIKLAKNTGSEIISADSRQCFKELSIGVARPTISELASVSHHFIASHSITEELNAGYFEKYALAIAEELFKKGNHIVMVGGTGLYIKAFCEGIDPMPEVPPAIRETIIHEYQAKGLIWLQSELKHKDPLFWKEAEQQNPQRLMRALEVINATGKSILHFRSTQKKQRPFQIQKIGLDMPMPFLTDRINQRVDSMMKEGLLHEAEKLIDFKDKTALQTVGYKELFEYFNGAFSLDETIARIKIHTRQYAKRQLTWFRKDPTIVWETVVK